MIPVVSSHVRGVEYDEGLWTLTVEFTDGSQYLYEHIPPRMWEALRNVIATDESVGRWLHANIRAFPTIYPYQRIKDKD